MRASRTITTYTCDGCGKTEQVHADVGGCPSGWWTVTIKISTGIYQGVELCLDVCGWECAVEGAALRLAERSAH